MLGMYLATRIFGHKLCSMLSILNELSLQMKLQNCIKMYFGLKVKNITTKQKGFAKAGN